MGKEGFRWGNGGGCRGGGFGGAKTKRKGERKGLCGLVWYRRDYSIYVYCKRGGDRFMIQDSSPHRKIVLTTLPPSPWCPPPKDQKKF